MPSRTPKQDRRDRRDRRQAGRPRVRWLDLRAWLPPLGGALLLVATVVYVEPATLLEKLSKLRFGFIALGASVVLPQLCGLALRWRLTAGQLGVRLGQREATREYALSMLLNQVLPLGIAGDAVRVARHARSGERGVTPALHAVVFERFFGQLLVIAWAWLALPLWFGTRGIWLSIALASCAFGAIYMLWRLPSAPALAAESSATTWSRRVLLRPVLRMAAALKLLLSAPRFLLAQLALSIGILLSITLQLYCALGSLGLSLPLSAAARVYPFMLLSMTLPLSIAGFGPREAATTQLYSALHLSAADGAAFGVAYGLLSLCTTLPCLLLVLCLGRSSARPRHSTTPATADGLCPSASEERVA